MASPTREIVVDDVRDTGALQVLYLLHGLAPFTFWTLAVVAVFLGAVQRDRYRGTWAESHISWLSRTFWWGLLWIGICAVITFVLFLTIIGWLVIGLPFGILFLWYLYRVLRGWLRLNDRLPAP
jgi:uncharacterized membrane protein